ncbi:MAG: LON peptidase substrate-binding domain-containing protein, partial [Bacillota bacterium]
MAPQLRGVIIPFLYYEGLKLVTKNYLFREVFNMPKDIDFDDIEIKEEQDIDLDDELELPLLASRGIVVFPNMVIPLLVGRDKSIEAIEESMMRDKKIIIASQKDEEIEEPDEDDIYKVGTIAEVKQLIKLPNGMIKVIVEGLKRAEILEYLSKEEYFSV